jgi:hypothetical protein
MKEDLKEKNIMNYFSIEEDKEFISKYIEPGLHSSLRLDELSWVKEENGRSPHVKVVLSNSNGQTLEDNFSFSEGARKYSSRKLRHMWDRHYSTEELQRILESSNGDMQDFIEKVSHKLVGRVFDEFKVSGKEIEGKEGKANWFKGCIGLPNFCSTSYSPRKLTFDKNNSYDYKRLEKHSSAEDLKSPWS